MEHKNLEILKDLTKQFNDNGYIESTGLEDMKAMNCAVSKIESYEKALKRIAQENVFGMTTQTRIAQEALKN